MFDFGYEEEVSSAELFRETWAVKVFVEFWTGVFLKELKKKCRDSRYGADHDQHKNSR